MKIFQKIKEGDKRTIYFLGFKFTYHKKNNKNKNKKDLIKPKTTINYFIPMNPHRIFNYVNGKSLSITQKKQIVAQIFMQYGNRYFPNLTNPRSLNEKITWLNLYYHDPLIIKCTDKCTFKDYLHETIGDEYTVPTYGIYNDIDEIDFDALPDEYVLKSNWGADSDQVIIVKDKKKINLTNIKQRANYWMTPLRNPYTYIFNYGYKDIKPKLIVEKYLKPSKGQLLDYKFFCFNGEPKVLFVAYNRFGALAMDYFDMNWKRLDVRRVHPNAKTPCPKPKNFEKMIELSRKLSKPFPLVRVDFYEVDGKLYVGELTFTPGGGVEPFDPVEFDYKLGELLVLPEKKLTEEDFE